MNGRSRADSKPHRRWRWWEKLFAYLILTAIASASIWLVDRKAMRVQNEQGAATTRSE